MVEEYLTDGDCYRCSKTTNIRCDGCNKYVCSDHCVIDHNIDSYSGEKMLCFECAQKTNKKKKEGCFIATAAYGTPFASELDVLRSFRDKRLKKSGMGRAFISFYYSTSPPVAEFIRERPILRSLVRAILSPFVSWYKSRK